MNFDNHTWSDLTKYTKHTKEMTFKYVFRSIVNSIYLVAVKAYANHFPLENISVLRMEDFTSNPAQTFKLKISPFLKLADLPMQHAISNRMKNKGTIRKKYLQFSESIVKTLQDFFLPYNRELASLTGNNDLIYQPT